MPNKLILDKSTLDDPQALADCKVGDTKTLNVTVHVTRDDPTIFEGDITDVEYSDSGQAAPDQEEAPLPPAQAEGPNPT